jgi:hypothetical protein
MLIGAVFQSSTTLGRTHDHSITLLSIVVKEEKK